MATPKESTLNRRPVRYSQVGETKSNGATYTPTGLADYVAAQIVSVLDLSQRSEPVRVLDPAAGDGELLLSLLTRLRSTYPTLRLQVFGFDTSATAARTCSKRLAEHFPSIAVEITNQDFLQHVIASFGNDDQGRLWDSPVSSRKYDLIIANPPYVRTQVMGAVQAQRLAEQFGLAGRVDLCHAFLIAMSRVLEPSGAAGIIVSNRFMTTRSGGRLRAELSRAFSLRRIWDLGDTKLFDVAVLPAVLIATGRGHASAEPSLFSSIYETDQGPTQNAEDVLHALSLTGSVGLPDGRRFEVTHGLLQIPVGSDAVWTISNDQTNDWLGTVRAHTWGVFGDIGKIRVGVKTCADSVFIRSDWDALPADQRPELLRPLMTHHVAQRFHSKKTEPKRLILYPHEVKQGQRGPVDLGAHPRSLAYLQEHRTALELRRYVIEAGRAWYEIWVPQDPDAWAKPKLVFRDISKSPTFWLDREGCVVNGDCYWMTLEGTTDEDLLWLALAVANSTFIERFYDLSFRNKLYAGRRRFITQYVEQFPLPDPARAASAAAVAKVKELYERVGEPESMALEKQLDRTIWLAFGLPLEESLR